MSLKCILQGQDLSKESLEAHIADKHNPHEVTAEQIGAATLADIPTSLPASDVYSWAKQPNKPSYTYSEIGAAASNHNHNNLYPTLTDFNSLKTSVSNGKSAVASAITDKGVSTSATASFDTMAGNIRSISSGSPRSHIDDNTFIYYDSGYGFGLTLYTRTSNPCKLPTKIGLKIVHKNQGGTWFPQYIYDYDEVVIPVLDSGYTILNVHYWTMSKKDYGTNIYDISTWSEDIQQDMKFYANKSTFTAKDGTEYYLLSVGLSAIGNNSNLFNNENDWKVDYRFIY